jgi:ubiquinone/menaquinone biosynthesis C-methylase UbiE
MNKTVIKEYYESHAKTYNQEFFETPDGYPTLLYRQQHMLELIDSLKLPLEHTQILDAGCGTGDMVKALAQRGYKIHASDIAQKMVDIATRKNQDFIDKKQVEVRQADVENLPYADQSFDLCILSGVVEYLRNDEEWMKQASRVLKPGGYLLLNVTNKKAIRRRTQLPFEWLKSLGFVRKIAGFVKEKLLRRGPLHYFNFRIRTHKPAEFDAWLKSKGFEKKAHAYFDYCFLPYPLDALVSAAPRKKLEADPYQNRYLRGCGYIVLAKKV